MQFFQILKSCYFAEQHRWVHWLPVGLIFGIAYYFGLAYEPGLLQYVSLLLLAATAVLLSLKNNKLLWLAYVVCGFCLGFCLIGTKVNCNKTIMLSDTLKDIAVSGTVENIENHPYKNDETLRITLNNVRIEENADITKIRLNAPYAIGKNWNIGDQLLIEVSLFPIPMPSSLYGYFSRRASFLQGISGTANFKKLINHRVTSTSPLAKYRHQLTQKLLTELEEPYGSVAAALVTGDKSYIPVKLRQAFADAGLAHVLAISGLHLSLITGLIFLLLRRALCVFPNFSNRLPIKKIAACLAMLGSGFYMAIANFGIPVQRSFVMICLAMFAICLDRTAFSMRSLAIAAIVVLLLAPQSLLSASFQLSFAAVLGLLAFYESAWPKLQEIVIKNSNKHLALKKFILGLLGILATTLIASLATTPFSVAFFQRFTAQAILGNLIAIPLVGFLVMPLALFSVTFLTFGGSHTLFWLWGKSLAMLCTTAELVAKLPGAAIQVKAVSGYALMIFSFGMLWLCIWKKVWRWLGMIPITLGIIFWINHELPIAYANKQCDVMAGKKRQIMYISNEKRNTYVCDIWSQEWGIENRKQWKNGYFYFKDSKIFMIESPKHGIEYLQKCDLFPDLIITFGYKKTLQKYGIGANKIIDRSAIQRGGGLAIFRTQPHLRFINDYFGQRPWCITE